MGVEKQIQIEKKEGESLSEQDRKDVDLINKFLLLHEAGDKAENEETIKMSSDKDSNKAWNDLESKFQGRILFVESNPNPDSYKVLNKWETIRKKQREILENKEKAILHNKELLKRLIIDYKEDGLMRDKEPARILEGFLLNYKQENVDKYNDFLKENGSSKEPISDGFLISDKRIEVSKKIYEKYDEDQKKLAEQIITKEYHQRIKNEFNCSDEEANKHQFIRKFNIELGYCLSDSDSKALFMPYEDSEEPGTVLPSIESKYTNKYFFIHEVGGHRITNGGGDGWIDGKNDSGLSDTARRLLTESINESISINDLKHPQSDHNEGSFKKYYSNLSERYARKKVVDVEMEDLGIKKYDEEFTEEHYNKLIEKYNETVISIQKQKYFEEVGPKKLLSKNTMEFIETTKRDPKIYMEIFNTIA